MNNQNRRLALFLSGTTDMMIGAAFLLVGPGFISIDIGVPLWAMILIGAFMFIAGAGVAVYNLSRWSE